VVSFLVLQVETESFDLPAKPSGIDQREIDLLTANPRRRGATVRDRLRNT
jgi:hypothetical protein